MAWFKETVSHKKRLLANEIQAPLAALAQHCVDPWLDHDGITTLLRKTIVDIPFCNLMYAIDIKGTLLSANVFVDNTEQDIHLQEIGGRPYLAGSLPYRGMILSDAYTCMHTQQPCLTAIQAVVKGDRLLGFIAADFQIKDLPWKKPDTLSNTPVWQQYRGDPSIREFLFNQQRFTSELDRNIKDLTRVISLLMQEHGVFHTIIHYSSSRFILWSMADPYCYRLHSLQELLSPELFLAYPRTVYPQKAVIAQEKIPKVLRQMNDLRLADESIYLRSGSMNVMNGLLGLTFSCDGSHYMSADEFLDREMAFWFGQSGPEESLGTKSQG